MANLLDFFNDRTEQLLDRLQSMVEYESPSHDKQLVDRFGAYLQTILQEMNAEITVFPREEVGDHILAKWNSEAPGTPILFLTHTDTVWVEGTLANDVPIKREDGRFHGPGALDMKVGITMAIEAIRGLQERDEFPNRPVWLLLTSDEEIGSIHSKELIIETAKQAGLVLVMEPATDSGGIKTWRKGIAYYKIKAKGLAAHAGGAPEEGINAIIELSHQAIKIHELNQLRKGTSVSVTLFDGGTAGNVIPAEATCYVDVRFLTPDEAERVDSAI